MRDLRFRRDAVLGLLLETTPGSATRRFPSLETGSLSDLKVKTMYKNVILLGNIAFNF